MSQIDPSANRVVHVIPVAHGALDVAVAAGRVWISAAHGFVPQVGRPSVALAGPGGQRVQPVRSSSCSSPYGAPGAAPHVLVVFDMPPQEVQGATGTLQVSEAIRETLRRHRFRAGRFAIPYQACDDSAADGPNVAKCRAQAQLDARDPSVVAIIGPYASDCTRSELPILNGAPPGALATVGASSTYVRLTQGAPGMRPDEPARYARSGTRRLRPGGPARQRPGRRGRGPRPALIGARPNPYAVYAAQATEVLGSRCHARSDTAKRVHSRPRERRTGRPVRALHARSYDRIRRPAAGAGHDR